MNLTPATEGTTDYLKAKGFGGTTDIVRIAIDRMATQEGMNTMDPKTAIKELMQKRMTKNASNGSSDLEAMKVLTGGLLWQTFRR